MSDHTDIYTLDPAAAEAPPTTVTGTLRRLGPSLILTATVVGSGELIITTSLGARAGFVCLWVILVACLPKVAVQLEFGKLVFRGRYRFIQNVAVSLTALFTVFTAACVLLLQETAYRVTLAEVAEGLSFELPATTLGVALAAFTTTGVSSNEIIAYPYWCVEKGYAKWTGPRDSSVEWAERARGWIRVMYWDALLSMVIYTLATAAFYILGAAILHGQGVVPEGYEMIATLSRIYTESFGPGAMAVFLVSSVVVLFSTLFVNCAAMSRMISDGLSQFGHLDFHDDRQRERWIARIAWGLALSWSALFLTLRAPAAMIIAGGAGLSLLLLVIVYAAYDFRYRRLDRRLRPGRFYNVMLWIGFATIVGVGVKVAAGMFVE